MGVGFAHADSDKVEGKSEWGEICGNFLPLKVFKPKYVEFTSLQSIVLPLLLPVPARNRQRAVNANASHSFIYIRLREVNQTRNGRLSRHFPRLRFKGSIACHATAQRRIRI